MYSQYSKPQLWEAISAIAMIFAVGFGAWWTAVAAYEGEVGAMFVRFGLSVLIGLYYVVLHRIAGGRSIGLRAK